jgi:hypothetical protein
LNSTIWLLEQGGRLSAESGQHAGLFGENIVGEKHSQSISEASLLEFNAAWHLAARYARPG